MGRLFRFGSSQDNSRYGDTVVHPSPWPDWFATQEDVRSVWICDKASSEKIKVEPPVSWGMDWTWNVTGEGTGLIMRRTA